MKSRHKLSRKLLAMFFTLVMLLTVLPVGVFADEDADIPYLDGAERETEALLEKREYPAEAEYPEETEHPEYPKEPEYPEYPEEDIDAAAMFAEVLARTDPGNPALRIWNTHIPLINPPGNVSANGVNAHTGAARVSYPGAGTGLQDTWWHEQIFAIGNGRLAGMVFGAPGLDRLAFHCKTHWAGGPHPTDPIQTAANNPGGNRTVAVTREDKELLRQQLDDKTNDVWGLPQATAAQRSAIHGRIGGPIGANFGANGVVGNGDIIFDFAARAGMTTVDFNSQVTNYMRDLDLNTAISTISYTFGNVNFHREIFVSHPDNVMVVRFMADEPRALNFDIEISSYSMLDSANPPASGAVQRKNAVINRDITTFEYDNFYGLRFTSEIENNGLLFNSQLIAINSGGTVEAATRLRQQLPGRPEITDGMLRVTDATEVVLIFAGGTDYQNIYPNFRTGETFAQLDVRIHDVLSAAVEKGYEQLRARHIADHWELFSRVSMDLSGVNYVPGVPTDELLLRYQRSLVPERPFVDVVRINNSGQYIPTGESSTVAMVSTSCQWNATWGNIRLNDGDLNTVWFSTNVSNPWAIFNFGETRRVDKIQLVAVTPEFIVEVSPTADGDDWINVSNSASVEYFGIDMSEEDFYHEFMNVELVLANTQNVHRIRVRWDSERIGLGNRDLMVRSLAEMRAYDTSRSAVNLPIATENEKRAAEVLAYQMGRYMAIAGSRLGDDLPTNLCGIWLIGPSGGLWNADFHFNINLQMNYWPLLTGNLIESHRVLSEFVASGAVRDAGRNTTRQHHAAGLVYPRGPGVTYPEIGFQVHVQNSAFGHTAPGAAQEWGWHQGGTLWALQNVYDEFLFSRCEYFLRELAYPMMREMANFWRDYLWWSDYQQRWTSSPSHSAEHGPTVIGVTSDQMMVWDHFRNTIEAARILGVDEDLIPTWQYKMDRLDPIQIGLDGQIVEWYEETHIGTARARRPDGSYFYPTWIPTWRAGIQPLNHIVAHRHIANLMGLHPGNMINLDSPQYILDAAMVTLWERGFGATSWGKSHKLNFWARMGHGDGAGYMVTHMLGGGNGGFMLNMLSSHGQNTGGTINYTGLRIFQVDGNFGYASGINEMLLQSHAGYVEFLPAIPAFWQDGHVHGLLARGNWEIGMEWSDGWLTEATVRSNIGGDFVAHYDALSLFTVRDSAGNIIPFTAISRNRISFPTVAGETYTLTSFNNPFYVVEVVDAGTNRTSGAGRWLPGETVTIFAGRKVTYVNAPDLNLLRATRLDWRFGGWKSDNVTVQNPLSLWQSFEMPPRDVTVAATWTTEPTPVFDGTNPNVLKGLLAQGDVILSTSGNLGIFTHHSPFVIPEGSTLTVVSTLNVQGNAELHIYGRLVVQDGGRVNNQGGNGGTIVVKAGGELENNGYVENVTNSTVINYGTIVNNARFEIRANTRFYNCGGEVIGKTPLNIHRNAITCAVC